MTDMLTPWEVAESEVENQGNNTTGLYIETKTGETICDLYEHMGWGLVEYDNAKAHAAFIVCAVNNHDRLVRVLERLLEDSDDVDDEKLSTIPATTVARARQALAEAKK